MPRAAPSAGQPRPLSRLLRADLACCPPVLSTTHRLRAVDFHRKEDQLKKMKEKAALKNPDEFYFNMVRTKQVPPSRPPRPHAAAARMLRR